jgi:ABC-2 type transport system ATP-binding protein
VTIDGLTLRARADDGARAVPAVLAALDSQGVGVASVTVARPSLDDVYLRHAGRTFGEADAVGQSPGGARRAAGLSDTEEVSR